MNNQHDADTSFILAMHYRKPVILLEEAIKDYLPHLDPSVAKQSHAQQKYGSNAVLDWY